MYARETEKRHAARQGKYNLWFIITLFLAVIVLALTVLVYYVVMPRRYQAGMNNLFEESQNVKASHLICIEEDMTLSEIAERTDLTYDQLYEVMNIPEGTNPNTTLADLFESYKEEAEKQE